MMDLEFAIVLADTPYVVADPVDIVYLFITFLVCFLRFIKKNNFCPVWSIRTL